MLNNAAYLAGLLILCCFFLFSGISSINVTHYFNYIYDTETAVSFFACAGFFLTYFLGSYILKSKTAGFLSAVILVSSFWYKTNIPFFADCYLFNIGALQFSVPVILGGFLPWVIFLFGFVFLPPFSKRKRGIIFAFLILFLISIVKPIALIFPVFCPFAILCGSYWQEYIEEEKNKKIIQACAAITLLGFFTAGFSVVLLCFCSTINFNLYPFISFIIFSIAGFIFIIKNQRVWLFASILALSCAVSVSIA